MKLYFVSTNEFKIQEVKSYLNPCGIDVVPVNKRIQEILDIDVTVIARQKALEAFRILGHPCAVEHGALELPELNNLPGGLSKPVWDAIGDQLCSLLPPTATRVATAKSVVAYCDGRKIKDFFGETRGRLAPASTGAYEFQWDPVFIPEGETMSFGELGFPAKSKYSQARKAWEAFADYLVRTA